VAEFPQANVEYAGRGHVFEHTLKLSAEGTDPPIMKKRGFFTGLWNTCPLSAFRLKVPGRLKRWGVLVEVTDIVEVERVSHIHWISSNYYVIRLWKC
jgi:hypothetical protein